MKKIEENQLLKENRRLKMRISLLKSFNAALSDELDLAWGECLYRYYDFLEATQESYGPMLNPAPIKLRGMYLNAKCQKDQGLQNIDLNRIMAIESEGKYKWLYLKDTLSPKRETSSKACMLRVEMNFEELLTLLDIQKLRLTKISKGAAVNVSYFDVRNGHLQSSDGCEHMLPGSFFKKKMNKEDIQTIRKMKNTIEHMVSFRKIRVRSEFGLI
jgi:hypothetical protein